MERNASSFSFFSTFEQAKEAIECVLQGEPRSKYRKSPHCMGLKYIFPLDRLDIEVDFVSGGSESGIDGAARQPDEAKVTHIRLRTSQQEEMQNVKV